MSTMQAHQFPGIPLPCAAFDRRAVSAASEFARSIIAHSAFEWQVRVGMIEPIGISRRQTGFSLTVGDGADAGADAAWGVANARTSNETIMATSLSWEMRQP